jgi:integrase
LIFPFYVKTREGFIASLHADLDIPVNRARKTKPFTKEEVELLLLTCLKRGNDNLFLFISMYCYNALRRGEILKMRWSRIDLEKRGLLAKDYDTSTKSQRMISINDFVFPNAKDPKRHADVTGLKGSWKRLMIATELEGHTPHDLRRLWAVEANLSHALTDMQRTKFAGHSMDVQRKHYAKLQANHLKPLSEIVPIPKLESLVEIYRSSRGETEGKRGQI